LCEKKKMITTQRWQNGEVVLLKNQAEKKKGGVFKGSIKRSQKGKEREA